MCCLLHTSRSSPEGLDVLSCVRFGVLALDAGGDCLLTVAFPRLHDEIFKFKDADGGRPRLIFDGRSLPYCDMMIFSI